MARAQPRAACTAIASHAALTRCHAVGADGSAVRADRRTVHAMSTTLTMPTASAHSATSLPTEMLERFRSRAGDARPRQRLLRGGPGRAAVLRLPRRRRARRVRRVGPDLAELAASQRRLARYAPATALAMTHALLLGRHRHRAGAGRRPRRCAGSSRPPLAGEVFAAGHAEAGNDIPVLLSTCQAERVDGGYRLTGRKQFGSNGPAWRWLGAHAIDADAPGGPQIVHAFVERDEPGRDRRGDLGHARHAADAEPRHDPRRRVRPRRPHRAGRARRRRQRPVPRRHGDVAAVADRRRVPRASPTGRSSSPSTAPGARRRWRSSGAPTPTTRSCSTRSPRCTSSSTPPRPPSSASSPTGWPAPTTATRGCPRCTP